MARFMTNYIDPQSGRERLGTGPSGGMMHRYASVANVIKFALRGELFPAGQYNIYTWPEGGDPHLICTAYKTA